MNNLTFSQMFTASLIENAGDLGEDIARWLEEQIDDGDGDFDEYEMLERAVQYFAEKIPNPPFVPAEKWAPIEEHVIRSVAGPIIFTVAEIGDSFLDADEEE